MDSNEFSQEKREVLDRIMTQQPKKKKGIEKVSIDKVFRKIAEKNLRKDRELLERLAKI